MSGLPLALATLLAIVLLVAGVIGWRAQRARARGGLPAGQVIYSDTGGWEPAPALHAPRYGLVGKPDYLLRLEGDTIPVEVKPGRQAASPYTSDVLQLLAYCLLVEETTGQRPPYGLLRYREQTFRVPYDNAQRTHLLRALEAMRRDLACRNVHRSHDDPVRCRACGHREHCGQAL